MIFFNNIKFKRIADNRVYLFQLFTEAASAAINKNITEAIEVAIINNSDLELIDLAAREEVDRLTRSTWERVYRQKVDMYNKSLLKINIRRPTRYSEHMYNGIFNLLTEDELFNFSRVQDQVDLKSFELLIFEKGNSNVRLNPEVDEIDIFIL